MNRNELVSKVATQANVNKGVADEVITAFMNVVTDEVCAGGKVRILDFGTFELSDRPERTGYNPATGKKTTIAARKNPRFRAAKAFKDAANNQ